MAEHADRIVILTESEKFSRRSTVPLSLGKKDVRVITDPHVSDEARDELAAAGVELICA